MTNEKKTHAMGENIFNSNIHNRLYPKYRKKSLYLSKNSNHPIIMDKGFESILLQRIYTSIYK